MVRFYHCGRSVNTSWALGKHCMAIGEIPKSQRHVRAGIRAACRGIPGGVQIRPSQAPAVAIVTLRERGAV